MAGEGPGVLVRAWEEAHVRPRGKQPRARATAKAAELRSKDRRQPRGQGAPGAARAGRGAGKAGLADSMPQGRTPVLLTSMGRPQGQTPRPSCRKEAGGGYCGGP